MDRFESDLCTYLNAHANGDLRDPEKITERWATDKSIGHISLLLATLAAGSHYSDIEYPQRLELSTDFGKFWSLALLSTLTIHQHAGHFMHSAWQIFFFAHHWI